MKHFQLSLLLIYFYSVSAAESHHFNFRSGDLQNWSGLSEGDINIHVFHLWEAQTTLLRSVDESALTAVTESHVLWGLTPNDNITPGGGVKRYIVENAPDSFDAPGEWYLDRKRGILILWPPEVPRSSQVVLSVNATAVLNCVEASNLEFRGLGVENASACGIRIEKGENCRVVACEIRNVGTHGIAVKGDRHQIVGCDIHHTGDKAIAMDSGNRYTLAWGDSLIDNCHLHHTNRVVRAGSQAVSFLGVGNRLSHNVIHDTGYIAIRFGGNEHVLEHNRLFRTNVESAEGGVFYTGRD